MQSPPGKNIYGSYIGYLAEIIFKIVTRLSSIFRDSEFIAIEVLSVWSMKCTGTNVSFSISHSASKILDNFFPEEIPYVDKGNLTSS